jgi:hypothetical protein
MKCMTQMPVPPMAHAASSSHRARRRASGIARARTVQIRPSKDPSTDNVYERVGVRSPKEKCSTPT